MTPKPKPYKGYGEGDKVGWYCEVPLSLYLEFEKRFPPETHRGIKTVLTVTAIDLALRITPAGIQCLVEAIEDGRLFGGQGNTKGDNANADGSKDGNEPSGDCAGESTPADHVEGTEDAG